MRAGRCATSPTARCATAARSAAASRTPIPPADWLAACSPLLGATALIAGRCADGAECRSPSFMTGRFETRFDARRDPRRRAHSEALRAGALGLLQVCRKPGEFARCHRRSARRSRARQHVDVAPSSVPHAAAPHVVRGRARVARWRRWTRRPHGSAAGERALGGDPYEHGDPCRRASTRHRQATPHEARSRLTVNGKPVHGGRSSRACISPTSCASSCCLTGTHLGCEHGVCGACTLLIDGAPARSCITYAVACDGADVRTIEGFDDDAVMGGFAQPYRRARAAVRLLHAGHAGHRARHRDAPAARPTQNRIREELAGNLCRCTGYVGIVDAIRAVLDERSASKVDP